MKTILNIIYYISELIVKIVLFIPIIIIGVIVLRKIAKTMEYIEKEESENYLK